MRNKTTCFFCYSWDNSDYYDLLSYLKDFIEEETVGEVRVILDKRNYHYNEDFDQKLKKMKSYDLIVPFFSPEFNYVISSDSPKVQDRELKKEYSIIVELFDNNPNSVFPIILSGIKETSVPQLFSRINSPNINLWDVRKTKSKGYSFSKIGAEHFNKAISDLIGQAKYNAYNKSIEYIDAKQTIDKLFWLTDTTALPPSCLVKIDIYDDIIDQKCYFVAGRKGSGKSTFINNFRGMDKDFFETHYKRMVPIKAEVFNHDYVFNELVKKHMTDKSIMHPRDILTVFWQLYFIFQSIFTIGIEVEDGRNIDEERKKIFRCMSNKLKDLLSLRYPSGKYKSLKGDNVPKLIFMLTANVIDNQFNNIAIDRANQHSLYASFLSSMDSISILESLFGCELLEDFAQALDQCTKRIIISLDGFDTTSEDFRQETQNLPKDSDDYKSRIDYERYFFRTLIEVVSEFKRMAYNNPILATFQDYLDFCIVLPKDRFDQIIKDDRDGAKKRFCSLVWDAYDLLELIVFRLEYLVKKIDPTANYNSTLDIFERFKNALDYFPILPKNVLINIDGRDQKFDLFNYILRFSFWRPRDVISNFSSILAYAIVKDESNNIIAIKNGKPLDNEILKLTIKNNARRIIQKEMIDEYVNVFRNLDSVLNCFMYCNLINDVWFITEKLAKKQFDASFAYNLDKMDAKLNALYQLGLIGLYFDKESAKSKGYLHHICFSFNAGLEPMKNFNSNENYATTKVKIIFNPILCEKLSLRIDTSELLCNWSKEYILSLHKMKSIIHTI